MNRTPSWNYKYPVFLHLPAWITSCLAKVPFSTPIYEQKSSWNKLNEIRKFHEAFLLMLVLTLSPACNSGLSDTSACSLVSIVVMDAVKTDRVPMPAKIHTIINTLAAFDLQINKNAALNHQNCTGWLRHGRIQWKSRGFSDGFPIGRLKTDTTRQYLLWTYLGTESPYPTLVALMKASQYDSKKPGTKLGEISGWFFQKNFSYKASPSESLESSFAFFWKMRK